jgi:hypothetical protein
MPENTRERKPTGKGRNRATHCSESLAAISHLSIKFTHKFCGRGFPADAGDDGK